MSRAILLPSFNEYENLKKLLPELVKCLDSRDVVVVCDDSSKAQTELISKLIENYNQVVFLPGTYKSGRGAAVRRGFKWVTENLPQVEHILESDCDGSHRIKDIVKILNIDLTKDFIIGSRYLSQSEIIGWSLSRKIFSKFLNKIIPRILRLNINDITNGLRRYSKECVSLLLSYKQESTGFLYLSEQALILNNAGFKPTELPIIFENREFGKSSVGFRELRMSIADLYKVYKLKNIEFVS